MLIGWPREMWQPLTVFAHLQVIRQINHVRYDIVRPGRKVHISDGSSGEHEACQHLGEVVGGNPVAKTRVEKCALRCITELATCILTLNTMSRPTKGAMNIPTNNATTYAQAGRVMCSLTTTTSPRIKLRMSTARYHHVGVSL